MPSPSCGPAWFPPLRSVASRVDRPWDAPGGGEVTRRAAVTFRLAAHPRSDEEVRTVLNAPELARNPTLEDGEVVRRVLAGEKELFEVLLRRHDPRVYRTVRSFLRDGDEAEDAM